MEDDGDGDRHRAWGKQTCLCSCKDHVGEQFDELAAVWQNKLRLGLHPQQQRPERVRAYASIQVCCGSAYVYNDRSNSILKDRVAAVFERLAPEGKRLVASILVLISVQGCYLLADKRCIARVLKLAPLVSKVFDGLYASVRIVM